MKIKYSLAQDCHPQKQIFHSSWDLTCNCYGACKIESIVGQNVQLSFQSRIWEVQEYLAGSVSGVSGSGSQGCEVEAHLGCGDYFKIFKKEKKRTWQVRILV